MVPAPLSLALAALLAPGARGISLVEIARPRGVEIVLAPDGRAEAILERAREEAEARASLLARAIAAERRIARTIRPPLPGAGYFRGRVIAKGGGLEEAVAAARAREAAHRRARWRGALRRLGSDPRHARAARALDGARDALGRAVTPFFQHRLVAAWVGLAAARREALDLIFDGKRYRKGAGQAEVDEKVASVRAAYRRFRAFYDPAAALVGDARLHVAMARDLGERIRWEALLPDYTPQNLRSILIEEGAREARDRRVLAHNRRVPFASWPEKDGVRTTNLYRIAMGLPALLHGSAIHRAARDHSEEMARLGYFGHDSPIPEHDTPAKRLRKAGYTGSPLGENCAAGAPGGEAAFRIWYHSPPHHRNMLGRGADRIGLGQAGGLWTENFGKGGDKPDWLAPDPADPRPAS